MFSQEEWAVFHDDAERLLSGVEQSLLQLETEPSNGEVLNALCRDLHTLKGNAGFLGLVSVGTLAHVAEDMVDAAGRKGRPLNAEMVSALLGALDQMRSILDESSEGPREEHLAAIEPALQRLRSASGPAPAESKVTLEETLALSQTVAQALEDGSDRGVDAALDRLDQSAQSLGFLAYIDALRAFRLMRLGGREPVIKLGWTLAHRQLEASAEQGMVLFDENPASPAHEDPALMGAFLFAMGTLLGPLLEWCDGKGSNPVGDARALCAEMGLPHLLEFLDPLAGSDNPGAIVEQLGHALVELQETWQQRSGQRLAEDLRHVVQRAFDGRSPAPPRPKRATGKPPKSGSSKFLRLEVNKVANLMSLAGEIGLAVGSVFSLPIFQEIDDEDVRIAIDRVEGLIRELQDTSATLGLVPLGTAFGGMKRVARDLSRQTGKDFVLSTDGEDTEIDKVLVDALNEPLVHLIRNAVSHGLEAKDERMAAGKPEVGNIRLSARRQGNSVIVTVRDDGRGMSRDAIIRKAVAKGLIEASQAHALSDAEVWNLVFEPGLSTAAEVSKISGRGVGMDVVKTSIQTLGGTVSIVSRPGTGTAIRLHLPLTLAFLDSMVVRVGRCTFAIPVSSVSRVFRVESGGVIKVDTEGVDLIRVGQHLTPALSLESFYAEEPVDPPYEGRLVVVVRTGAGKLAIPIDELLGHEQVTMQPLTGYLKGIRASAGCGLLRNGGVAIALNCEQLHEIRQHEAA